MVHSLTMHSVLLLLATSLATASACTWLTVRQTTEASYVVHVPVESFEQAAFEAGLLAEINDRLSSPITLAHVVLSEVKTIVWDEHNLPSNYDHSYGTSTRVTVELTVTGGDAEAGLFSAALHDFTEVGLGLAINATVLDLGSIAARAYFSAGGDTTCENRLWQLDDGTSFTSTVALHLTLDTSVDDFTTAAQASFVSSLAPLVYADAERVRIESVGRSGVGQTDVVVEVASVSVASAIQLSTIWIGETATLPLLSLTLGETVVAAAVPMVRTLLLDGFASPSPSPPPPLPRLPPQAAAPPPTMTFGACVWEVVREYVEVEVVVHEPIEAFELQLAQFKSGLVSELNGELDDPIDSGSRVVISGLRTLMWDESNLPSNQIDGYGASTQATAEVVGLDGDDEAEAISRAMQTLTETELGDAIGADVQDISSPVVRLILSDIGDADDAAGCAATYWPEQPGVAYTVALRLLVSAGYASYDATMEANLLGGLAALLYTSDDAVRIESAESSAAQTDVVAEVAATSETNALRVAELLLTQMDAALTSAVGVVVTSSVPTVRSLLVLAASEAAVQPSPPPPPATPVEGDSAWFSGGMAAGVVIGAIAGAVLCGTIALLVLRSPRAHNCLGGKKPNNIIEARIPGQLRSPSSSEMTTAGVTKVLADRCSPGTAAHVTATRDAGGGVSGSLSP